MTFDQWAAKMMSMPDISYICRKCKAQFPSEELLASHMQKHRFLPITLKLSENDRNFLRANRIKPWEDDEPKR